MSRQPAPSEPSLIGGRYEVVQKLGAGAFGTVYKAKDRVLGRLVAIKTIRFDSAVATGAGTDEMQERFTREARVSAQIKHPNIVTVHDIGQSDGLSYLAMEFIEGTGLDRLLAAEGHLSVERSAWIAAQIADALDFAHRQNVVHRDVKPANVMIETGDHVKVADFGIAKATNTGENLTVTGALLGTPSYMSPEQARGGAAIDGRSDLFGVGCILYEMLTGKKAFRGDSITGILLKIVAAEPPPLDDLHGIVPPPIVEIVGKALAKTPEARYQTGRELAEALVPFTRAGSGYKLRSVGAVPVLVPIPDDAPLAGLVSSPATMAERPSMIDAAPATMVSAKPKPAEPAAPPPALPSPPPPSASASRGPLWIGLGAAVVVLVALGWFLSSRRGETPGATPAASTTEAKPAAAAVSKVGIAYGTEKKAWLEWAAAEFARQPAGKGITVDLIPMGSLEGAKAAISGDERIHVWAPASALYEDVFVQEWTAKHGRNPILKEETLALSPMVFVTWKDRHDAFLRKYKTMSFETIRLALAERRGWGAIAGKSEWGAFKYGHTDPQKSNSGLMALVAMAYEFHDKVRGLGRDEIAAPKFQAWMRELQSGVSGLSHSTGTMMKEMILKGPPAFDVLFVYENVVIEKLKEAEQRWGMLHVAYPERGMWNENPYYVLDAAWSNDASRDAAGRFLLFLLSDAAQQKALTYGFRPAATRVSMKSADSPFTLFAENGLRLELSAVGDPPRAAVIEELLASWQKNANR